MLRWWWWVLWLTACGAPERAIDRALDRLASEGRVQRIETLGDYSGEEAALLLGLAGNRQRVSLRDGFSLYRVVYPTRAIHGGETTVSGLLAIPEVSRMKGIVSWQHGTNTYRPRSISQPTVPEGVGVAALFASDGYLMVAPDYIGLGVSHEVQGYYHWPSTVSTVLDLIAIAEAILESAAPDSDRALYLSGFSQGGGATAAVQRSLQRDNPTRLQLRAAAAISGAFNPGEVSFDHFIKQGPPSTYLGLILTGFAYVYGEPLGDIVQSPYDEQLSSWFDGTHDEPFLRQHLPEDMADFLTPRFLEDSALGIQEPRWFYAALEQARTDDYAPEAPLRLYYATRDETAIPEEATHAFEHMRGLGGNVNLVDTGPYSHDEIVLQSLPSIQQWFDRVQRGDE